MLRKLAVVAVVVLTAITTMPRPTEAQGNCALCEDCFNCVGGKMFGTTNCDMESGDPECPCQQLGQPCNPTFALGIPVPTHELVNVAGDVQHLLPLTESIFGQFDCGTGDLVAVFASDGAGDFRPASEDLLADYRERIHLSNYLDETDRLAPADSGVN